LPRHLAYAGPTVVFKTIVAERSSSSQDHLIALHRRHPRRGVARFAFDVLAGHFGSIGRVPDAAPAVVTCVGVLVVVAVARWLA
jgi:hypothetical protein